MDHLPLSDIPMLVSTINFLLRDEIFENLDLATIAALREKYDLHMTVERYTGADMPETDNQFIRH